MPALSREADGRERDQSRRTDSLLGRVFRRGCSYLDDGLFEDGFFAFVRIAADDAGGEGVRWVGKDVDEVDEVQAGGDNPGTDGRQGKPTGDVYCGLVLRATLAWLRAGRMFGSLTACHGTGPQIS